MTPPAGTGAAEATRDRTDTVVAAPSDQEARRRVLHRLRRAQGQLSAVIRAVEEGRHCRDVVTQLAATSKALDRAGVILISNALQDCHSGVASEDDLTADELEKLFMMFA